MKILMRKRIVNNAVNDGSRYVNAMTDNEISRDRERLSKIAPGGIDDRSDEVNLEYKELDCRDMINSILAYHYTPGDKSDYIDKIMDNRYMQRYIDCLGYDRVRVLVKEQVSDYRKSTLLRGTFQDSEGLVYNGINWYDEV